VVPFVEQPGALKKGTFNILSFFLSLISDIRYFMDSDNTVLNLIVQVLNKIFVFAHAL
jgi:hypothetical protein